jgi:hypothetical protein
MGKAGRMELVYPIWGKKPAKALFHLLAPENDGTINRRTGRKEADIFL